MATCTICSSGPARGLADGALLSGEKPVDVWRLYLEPLGISLSATYRHAKGHTVATMVPRYLGDRTVGDHLADLAALARSNYESHVDAKAKGLLNISARFGAEARQAYSDLLRLGFETEAEAEAGLYYEHILFLYQSLLHAHRDLLAETAATAHGKGWDALAVEILDVLPAAFDAWDSANPGKAI